MKLASLSLRLRVFLFFAALAAGNIGALIAGMVFLGIYPTPLLNFFNASAVELLDFVKSLS